MIPALVMMCAIQAGACQWPDARRIAEAIDRATDDDGLRAHLVVNAWEESSWHLRPRAMSWDAKAGLARGPWQLWQGGDADVLSQAHIWLDLVQRKPTGLAGMCGSGAQATRMAYRRAQEAVRLLELVTGTS